jgi:hypothetical protein
MPVHQSYRYGGGLVARRPSMLRIVGEAIIGWADKREAARAERRRYPRCPPSQLPGYLRRDLGLGAFTGPPTYQDRW